MPRMKSRAPARPREASAVSELGWKLPTLRGPRYSQSLERGLTILGCFTPERSVLGIADVAEELDMSRSTTHRYMTTLHALGLLEQGPARKYRLGLGVTSLGMSALNSTSLREHVRPFVDELRRRTGYTIGVAVLDGSDVLFVERARSLRRHQRNFPIKLSAGSRVPAHCTAMGKILLANLPRPVRRELLTRIPLERSSTRTITSRQKLRSQLEQVAHEDFAINGEELRTGVLAIAVPVRDESDEVVAALGMSASADAIALEELVDALGPHLRSTALGISARLGYRRAHDCGPRD